MMRERYGSLIELQCRILSEIIQEEHRHLSTVSKQVKLQSKVYNQLRLKAITDVIYFEA